MIHGSGKTCHEILCQYPEEYKTLLGSFILGNDQIGEIILLMKQGALYAGSDGSVKNGIGSHAYGFTSRKLQGKIWGGASITPGAVEEMSSLQAEHGGAMEFCSLCMQFRYTWAQSHTSTKRS